MTRIILLAGNGGAGTSTMVRATAEAAAAPGVSVRVIDAADPGLLPSAQLRELVSATIGSMAVQAGAERLIPQAWESLAGARHLAALDGIRRASIEDDLVVVDAGSLVSLRDLLNLPGVLLRLLDASLTPRTAMARTADGALFDALSEARLQVLHLGSLLGSSDTTVRLVARSTDDAIAQVAKAAASAGLLGVAVDGVVLPRFPRRKDGAPDAVRRQAQRAESALRQTMAPVPVWRSFTRPRPAPKGSSVLDRLAVDTVLVPADEPTPAGGGFRWDLSMPPVLRDRVRVGVQAGSLVLETDGVHRWVELPSVLRRCSAVDWERTEAGIVTHWIPDAAVWPSGAREEGADV